MNFSEMVYALCRQVPKGKVTTYKSIAQKLGTTSYRAVGQALKRNPSAPDVPCHRVIKSDGCVGGYCGNDIEKIKVKVEKLRREGVEIVHGQINLEMFGFFFRTF